MDWKEKAIDMTNKDILSLDFDSLVNRIQNTSDILQQDACVVINKNVTTRAWLTGFYIVEYEQHGNDRAKYGEKLLQNLSKRLDGKSFGLSNLKNYRQFYLQYPQLAFPVGDYLISRFGKSQTVSDLFQGTAILLTGKSQSANGFFQNTDNQMLGKSHSLNGLFEDSHPQSVSRDGFAMQLTSGEVMPVPQMLFSRLSFTHIVQILHLNNPPISLLLNTNYNCPAKRK